MDGWMDGWTEGRTEGRTGGRTDGLAEGRTDGHHRRCCRRRRRRYRHHHPILTIFLNFFCPQVMSGSIDLMHTGLSNFKCFVFGVNNKDSCYRAMNTTILRGYDSA